MKLRSPESYWFLKNGILNSYPSLQENIACDIAVIGSGVTGALISYALHNAGFEIVLIDKRDAATGSSAATTSMLQYEIEMPLSKLSEIIGEKGAVECYRAGIRSIDILENLIKTLNIDCGFERKKSLQVAHNKIAADELKEEFALREKHKFNVQWLTTYEIRKQYNMHSFPGILSDEAASFDAYRFAHGLLAHNHKKGMPIYDRTHIRKIKYEKNRSEILTEEGFRIFCKRIVFCTGYEALLMFKKKYADVLNTFSCVSEEDFTLFDDLKDLLIWDTAEPYFYARTTDDKRMLVSSEDAPFKSGTIGERVKDRKAERLIKRTRKLFPEINFKEDFNWSGALGVTKDGLPFFGEHPDYPGAVFMLALGGNGIIFSVQGMELILKILAKEPDTFLNYYRFDR